MSIVIYRQQTFCVYLLILMSTLALLGSVGISSAAAGDMWCWYPLASGIDGIGSIRALAVAPDGTVYVGGSFRTAGGVSANFVAKWDGAAWSGLHGGMNSTVNALAVAPDGTLYAGGYFTTAGGVAANHIAKWDGNGWSGLGNGLNSTVNALAVASDGTLYAGGEFRAYYDPTLPDRVARWDGSSWSALGPGPDGTIFDLVAGTDGVLYAAGWLDHVAKWDGAAWSQLGSGMQSVTALALASDGTLYVGGRFTVDGGVSADQIAKWDGSAWSALGPGMSSWVTSLVVTPQGILYAGGMFDAAGGSNTKGIAKWDGTAWSSLGSDLENIPNAVIINALASASNGTLYVGGNFNKAGGISAKSIARWSPVSVPDAPTGVTAEAKPARTMISFVAPMSNSCTPITYYTVTSIPGNKITVGTESPITVKGLTVGVDYKFQVTATNGLGTSQLSKVSNTVKVKPDISSMLLFTLD